MNEKVCRVKKNLALRVGIALGRRFFLRFFYKKIDNFLTKIDIDLIFFLEIAYELGAIIKIYELKKKLKKKEKKTQKKIEK